MAAHRVDHGRSAAQTESMCLLIGHAISGPIDMSTSMKRTRCAERAPALAGAEDAAHDVPFLKDADGD